MSNINAKNYKGRVWTCDQHNNKIEAMINDGETEKAMNLVAILNPKQGRQTFIFSTDRNVSLHPIQTHSCMSYQLIGLSTFQRCAGF